MMKKYFLIFVLAVFASSCEDKVRLDNCAEVRIVEQFCGQYVLQIVNGAFQGEIISEWTNGDGTVYQNVFSTFTACGDQFPTDGSTFFVELAEEDQSPDCGVCLGLLANTPEAFNYVRVKSSCDPENGVL